MVVENTENTFGQLWRYLLLGLSFIFFQFFIKPLQHEKFQRYTYPTGLFLHRLFGRLYLPLLVTSQLPRWFGRNRHPRLLYAPRCWDVVYDLHVGTGLLFSTISPKQTYLFLFAGSASILDANVVLYSHRNTPFCI